MAIAAIKLDDNGANGSARHALYVEAQPARAGEAGRVWTTWHRLARDGAGWVGAVEGQRRAQWFDLGRPGA